MAGITKTTECHSFMDIGAPNAGRMATNVARTVAGTLQRRSAPTESFSAGHCSIQSLLWRGCHGSGVFSRKGFLFMEQFSDRYEFSHLHVTAERGARSVIAFNAGWFRPEWSEQAWARIWYSTIGLLRGAEPCIVIPIDGLDKMSDADKLAALYAGLRFAELAVVEKDILDSETQERMPYILEADILTLEQFRQQYKAEHDNLQRFAHASELVSKALKKIQPIWEGKNEEAGFIYCLHDQLGHFKIGLTKNLTQRIKQLSTQPPFNLTLVCAFRVLNATRYEGMLHEKYSAQRLNGEWFELSPDELDSFIKEHAGKEFITEEGLEALQSPNGQRLLPG